MSSARVKNRAAFAASPARHFPAACSYSSAASRKSFSDWGAGGWAFDFGLGFRRFFFGGMVLVGVVVVDDVWKGGNRCVGDEF